MENDLDQALRYLGAGPASGELREQVGEVLARLEAQIQPRYTYRIVPLERREEGFGLEGTGIVLPGRLAGRMLEDCGQAALLACTLGAAFDQRLSALQARDMAQAVIWDACGSALVERGCGQAEEELAGRFPGLFFTDRFSPGYGDLPLDLQPALCAALDTPRRLGLYVTDSLLLNPVKSVTAVIGLSERPQPARVRGCAYCQMREHCPYRKGGTHCGEQI